MGRVQRAGKAPLAMRLPHSRLAALVAVLALWFAAGVAVEVAAGKLDRISWWLLFYMLIGLLLVLLGASLAATRRGYRLSTVVVEGALTGVAALLLFALGVFLPFAAGLGGRDLDEFGGEFDLGEYLTLLLGGSATVGALLGAFAGVLGWWALKPRRS